MNDELDDLNEQQKKLCSVIDVAKEFQRQYFCYKKACELGVFERDVDRFQLLVVNNFYDMALLNWAHLFGNDKDFLHFKNCLPSPEEFLNNLMKHLGLNAAEWHSHWKNLKDFRDWRIAHKDNKAATVACLDTAYRCVLEYQKAASKLLNNSTLGLPISEKDIESYKDELSKLMLVDSQEDNLKR